MVVVLKIALSGRFVSCTFGQQTLCAAVPDFQSGTGSWALRGGKVPLP